MSDSQAVIDKPDTEPKASDEGANAQDDLDSLLNEFDQQATPAAPEPQRDTVSVSKDDLAFLKQDAEERRQERAKKETQEGITSAVSTMKPNLERDLPEALIEGYLIREVENDPRALGLWQQRHTHSAEWSRYVEGVGKKLNKEISDLPDKKLSEDRDVVTSAVHSASNHAPQETELDWAGMSQTEFEQQKMKLARAARKSQ